MKTLKQLRKEELKLKQQMWAIEEKERQEKHIPALKKFIGRYFAYRNNSYGSGTPYWDEFYKIIDFINDSFIVENCSIDCYGKTTIQIESKFIYIDGRKPFAGDAEEEITKEEYESARSKVCGEFLSQSKMREDLIKN